MSHFDQALEIALRAHKGQTDRNDRPYILHPLRVMQHVTTDNEKLAAILHDVVEDSETTLDDLRAAGLPEPVVMAVDALTRYEGESYIDLVQKAKRDAIALPVKLGDLADHLAVDQLSYSDENSDDDMQRFRRYIRATLYLQGKMTEEQYLGGAKKDEQKPKKSS